LILFLRMGRRTPKLRFGQFRPKMSITFWQAGLCGRTHIAGVMRLKKSWVVLEIYGFGWQVLLVGLGVH